jgi:SAM-dependent methyltransferase
VTDQPAVPITGRPDRFFREMGGYHADDSYESVSRFLERHLYSEPRLAEYDRFLRPRIGAGDSVLSIASGRCANEVALIQHIGCRVVCSDLAAPPCIDATRRLLPGFTFECLDVLSDAPPAQTHDVVVSLSLIYAFDDQDLRRMLEFCHGSLKPGGRLLLDLAGPPDNWASRVFHDVYLPVESWAVAGLLSLLRRRRYRVERFEAFGYRRTWGEVRELATACGFTAGPVWSAAYSLDFMRSYVGRVLLARRLGRWMLDHAGRAMPYVRLVELTKER